jgi:ADP-heptose:LPS heptosyltransferase
MASSEFHFPFYHRPLRSSRARTTLLKRTSDNDASAQAPIFSQPGAEILVTRFKSIGDILFTLPAIHALRENYPNAKITFLTSREFAPLVEAFRDVNEVVTIDRSRFRGGNPVTIGREMLSLWRLLRQRKFSLVVDLQGYGETALMTWLTRAPHRWGTVYESTRRYAYTRGVTRDRAIHPAEGNLLLLKQCGLSIETVRNEFILPDNFLAEARELFKKLGLDAGRPVLFIQPFTSSARKNWPLENYLALATHFREAGVQVLFGGGPGDRSQLEPVSRAGFPVSAGAPLLVSAGLVKLSTVVLGGDTGLLHIAAAMNKRVVFLVQAARYPNRFYPFRHPDWKITPPKGERIADVTVATVIAACQTAFAEVA